MYTITNTPATPLNDAQPGRSFFLYKRLLFISSISNKRLAFLKKLCDFSKKILDFFKKIQYNNINIPATPLNDAHFWQVFFFSRDFIKGWR